MIGWKNPAADRSREPTIKKEAKPYLIFTWGNPSRGDDAIGPAIHDYLATHPHDDVDVLTDFQLQIEHSQDLMDKDAVIFVDASVSCATPYEFYRILPERADSYTTHAMSPQTVLAVFEQVNKQPAPDAFMLTVRGTSFELGEPLSEAAHHNMQHAIRCLNKILDLPKTNWLNHVSSEN